MWNPVVPMRVTQVAPTHLNPRVFGVKRERIAQVYLPTPPQAAQVEDPELSPAYAEKLME
jgi:hypothetical protein